MYSCADSVSIQEFETLAEIINYINDEVVSIAHGKLDPQFDKSAAAAFAELDVCPSMRGNVLQYGGAQGALIKAAIKFSAALAIALAIYGAVKATAIDRTNCYAWYTPFATLVRTPIQNSYCTVLRNVDRAIDDVVRKGLRLDDMNQVLAMTSIFSTGAITLKTIFNSIRRFNSSLDSIVDHVYNVRDANFRQDAVHAVQNIFDKLVEKAIRTGNAGANNANANANVNANANAQSGGARKNIPRKKKLQT